MIVRLATLLLALCVVACGHAQPTQWVVDGTLPVHIQEAAVEAAQAWCDADESLCVPVVIGERDEASGWITAGESESGEAASCITQPGVAPVIYLDLRLSYWVPKRILMHEMGHAFSGSPDHLSVGRVMGVEHADDAITADDINYARGAL